MLFPKQIQNLIEAFERLPGVGPKSAARLAFYLLHVPDGEIKRFGEAVLGLKVGLKLCAVCKNITSSEICDICSDSGRDKNTICVVETALDVFSFEKAGKYEGLYHVLGGVIDPLHNIGPDELRIADLIKRIADSGQQTEEIILALNPTMEGEATAMYISQKLKVKSEKLKVTRLGMGMPTGGDIQYADETTLSRALEGRRIYE